MFDWSSRYRNHSGSTDENADEINELAVWNDLKREVRQHFDGDPTLSQFLQELHLRPKASPPRRGDVQCLTIQLAKGKEFQHVYLAGLVEGQLPSHYARKSGDDSREIEEERRKCFVAITRVQSSLTLTFADSYFGRPKKCSRFLTEMGLSRESVAASR